MVCNFSFSLVLFDVSCFVFTNIISHLTFTYLLKKCDKCLLFYVQLVPLYLLIFNPKKKKKCLLI